MSGKGPFGQDYEKRSQFLYNASYNNKKDDCVSETDSSQDSVEIIKEVQAQEKAQSKLKNTRMMKKVFSDSSVSEDVTPVKKKDNEPPVSPVFSRSGSKTSRSGSESSKKSGSSRRELELSRRPTTETTLKKDIDSGCTQLKTFDDSIDDLLKDSPYPSREHSTGSTEDLFEGTEGFISCSPKKKSRADIFDEDKGLLVSSQSKGSASPKKKNKGKLSSPRKKAVTGRELTEDDSSPAAKLLRGSSSLSRKNNDSESIAKLAKSNSSLKRGMFKGLHEDNSDDEDDKRSAPKFKFNSDGKKENRNSKSKYKGTAKSSLKVKANDTSSFLQEHETSEVKPSKFVRDVYKISKSEGSGSGSSQEETSKGVKRKLRDSGEKSKGDQDHSSRRNPFKINQAKEKSKNNNDSSEEESISNAKFSFDSQDKKDFKTCKESSKSKSSKKKSDEGKTVKTLHEFDMFLQAGNMAKKKALAETFPSITPSSSTQKLLKVSNFSDYTDQDNLIKSLKKRTKDRRSLKSISKMSQLNQFSQSMSQDSSQSESSSTKYQRTSYDHDPDFSFKKPRKKEKSSKSSQGSQPKINKFVKDKAKQKDEELALTIDELLTLPEKPDDEGKSMDELLDDLDVQIADQKEKHRLQIKKLDADAMIQQKRKEDREVRYAANAINRDLLATELTQPTLRKMFADIRGSLEDIKDGLIESSRHKAFHKSLKTRQALLYTMITHPFTDKQVDWVYEEMASIWLRTKQEHADNNEYIWKVLMPESFIRLYSDFFKLTMKEAEQRIKETPFDDSDESSDNSSDNEN